MLGKVQRKIDDGQLGAAARRCAAVRFPGLVAAAAAQREIGLVRVDGQISPAEVAHNLAPRPGSNVDDCLTKARASLIDVNVAIAGQQVERGVGGGDGCHVAVGMVGEVGPASLDLKRHALHHLDMRVRNSQRQEHLVVEHQRDNARGAWRKHHLGAGRLCCLGTGGKKER